VTKAMSAEELIKLLQTFPKNTEIAFYRWDREEADLRYLEQPYIVVNEKAVKEMYWLEKEDIGALVFNVPDYCLEALGVEITCG
jgi:hypothetical protein